MKCAFLITTILFTVLHSASGQELKAKKKKALGYSEEYSVLASDKKIRHGDYKKYRTDESQILTGKFDNNSKIGEWKYSENGELEQVYSYSDKKMTFQKKSAYSYSVVIDNQIRVSIVDTPPAYIGSKISLTDDLNQVLNYPLQAKRMGIEGPVTVGIWINADNSLGEIQVIKGIMKDCDQEVLSALKKIPGNWVAATLNGKQVKSMLVVKIVYALDNILQDAAITVE